jgi:uncharacterized membrane protein (UPF0127 family)
VRIRHHRDGETRALAEESVGRSAGDGRGLPDDAGTETLADDVDEAAGPLSQARGLMFRRSIPKGYAMVFRFDEPASRTIHSLFVFEPIDVLWLVDDEVTRVERLRPFRGLAHGLADTVIELSAGGADGVEPGDTIEIVE